jgi:hypothetical protein
MHLALNIIGFIIGFILATNLTMNVAITVFRQIPFLKKMITIKVIIYPAEIMRVFIRRIILGRVLLSVLAIYVLTLISVDGLRIGVIIGSLLGFVLSFSGDNEVFVRFVKDIDNWDMHCNSAVLNDNWIYFRDIVYMIQELEKENKNGIILDTNLIKNLINRYSLPKKEKIAVAQLTDELYTACRHSVQKNIQFRDTLMNSDADSWLDLIESHTRYIEKNNQDTMDIINKRNDILSKYKPDFTDLGL